MTKKVVRFIPNKWMVDNSGTDWAGNGYVVLAANEEGGVIRILTWEKTEPMARQRAEEHLIRHHRGYAAVLRLQATYQPDFKIEEVEVSS